MATRVLVIYYSLHGHVEALARSVGSGAESVRNTDVRLRRIPDFGDEKPLDRHVDAATLDDLRWADGIAWGRRRRGIAHGAKPRCATRPRRVGAQDRARDDAPRA